MSPRYIYAFQSAAYQTYLLNRSINIDDSHAASSPFPGIKIETLKHCCGLGTNYANSGLKCSSFQTPIAGIQKEDEHACLNSIDVCCKNRQSTLRCNLGKEDAKSGKSCTTSADADDNSDIKKVITSQDS